MESKIENLIYLSGGEGRYQYCALFLAFLVWSISAFHSISLPFLEAVPNVNLIPYNQTVPLNYSICDKYKYNYTKLNDIKYSWIIDFEIECSEVKVGLIGTFTYIGFTSGSFLYPIFCEILSNKNIILIGMAFYCSLNLIISFFQNYYIALVSLIFLGICTNISNYSSMTIVSESVTSKKRSVFSSIINIGFCFSALIFTPLFFFLQKWSFVFYCHILISIVILIAIYFILFNSPRKYMNTDKEKMLEILRGISKFNKKLENFNEKIKEEEYQNLLDELGSGEKEMKDVNIKENENGKTENKKKLGYLSLIKYPSIRYKFIIFSIMFMTTSAIYNGIAIGAKNMKGNLYLNIVLLYWFEGLAYIVTGFLINCKPLGRKFSLFLLFLLSALGFLAYVIMVNHYSSETGEFISMLLVRFTISGVYTTYYTYILESYPTPIRSKGFGLNSTFGNIGGIVIPMFIELFDKKKIYYIFAGMCGFDCFLVLFLKETVGSPMQESIEELEEEKRKIKEGKLDEEKQILPLSIERNSTSSL